MNSTTHSFLGRLLPAALLLAACLLPRMPHRTPERMPVRVRMLFGGDVMQHMPQVEAARRGDGFDYGPCFEALRPLFRRADLAVVNLETTLTRSGRYTGYPLFRSPAALADALHEAGVDAAVLANNHCCDGGAEGIRTTLGELDRCGIAHTGVFADSLSAAEGHPLYFNLRGIRVALLDYTYGTNGMPVPRGMAVNRIDTLRMAADLEAARRCGADYRVVCIHWGTEYESRPDDGQRRLAAALRRYGADAVIGSHPHVVQAAEADSSFIAVYSLGNLVSNQRKRRCDGGLLAEVTLTRYPDGRLEHALRTIPVWVAMPGYRILPAEAIDTAACPSACRIFLEDTAALLGKGA